MRCRKRYGWLAWVAGFVLLACFAAGCTPADSASLSGKVTYDGEAIPKGNIRLQPTGETEAQAAAGEIVNGSYEVSEGLFAGQYKVIITATRPATPEEIAAMKAADDEPEEEEEEDEDEGGAAPAEPTIQYIPPKYNQSSELTIEITPGENTKDFTLTP